ncbi:MAG: gamma-glutamylcyclotransferase [Rubrivivax sp.]|nr:gamma-glutamylcyclotransferase [Rubrivivax sp.]
MHPAAVLDDLQRQWGPQKALWVFGYASLIWRPEFHADEQRGALVHGWHRALRMRSRINRGTPERPGLVFALLPGGACRGEVYRLPAAQAEAELERLWQREMPTGVYTPRWLPCRTPQGTVPALAFTLHHGSEACLGRLPDAEVLDILRHARGRYGTTLEYLERTALALRERGIVDVEIERLMALAARAGLVQATPAAARAAARSASVSTSINTPGSSSSTAKAG